MNRLILLCILLLPFFGISQKKASLEQSRKENIFGKKKPLLEIKVKKMGPYFGIQRGEFTIAEFGVERQWKRVRLINPQTHAAHLGFNYNFKHNILGYDLGYWFKTERLGLTYGANIFMRTNFTDTRVGIAPVIGYKIWLLHLQTGYHFMPRLPEENFETNTYFISLRMVIINKHDTEFKWRNGKK